jgi:fibronectin-binding autotransporter adhesin
VYRLVAIGLATVLYGSLAAGPASAILINDPTAARNGRFSSGYPAAPLPNGDPSFIGAGYDWSGVGWAPDYNGPPYYGAFNGKSSYALLGPRNYLYANHWPASNWGNTVNFLSTDNVVKTYTVQNESGSLLGDLAVGTFTQPISASDNVHYYSILFEGYSGTTYIGKQLLNYGWTAQVGWNQVSDVDSGANLGLAIPGYYFKYLSDRTSSNPTPDRTELIGGDSGSPSFFVDGAQGQMYLAGAHYAVSAGTASYDTSLALMLPQISTEMAKTGYLPYVVTPVSARWISNSSGAWNTDANWSTGSKPIDSLDIGGKVIDCASVLFDGAAASQHGITLGGGQKVTGITFNPAAGANAFTFSGGGSLTIGEAGIRNLDNEAQTFNCNIALRSSQRWDVGSGGLNVGGAISPDNNGAYLLLVEGAGNAIFSGAISDSVSGSMGLSKDGAGTLSLTSAGNSYSGKTFINGGTIAIGLDSHLGAAPGSAVAGQLTIDGGTLRTTQSLALAANRGIAIGSLGGTLSVDNGTTLTGNSIIAGTGPFTKAGAGTLVLNAANTYSGLTQVQNGTLSLAGANGSAASSAALAVFHGATLRLDNTAANNANRIGQSLANVLLLSGGTLDFLGNAGAASSENVGPLALGIGASTVNAVSGAGQSATLNIASLSRAAGMTINFTGAGLGGGGNNPSVYVSGLTNASGIVGAYATVGGDWATVGAFGATALSAYQTDADPANWSTADNVKINPPLSANVGTRTINSLNIADNDTVTQSAGATLTLASGGILASAPSAAAIAGGTIATTGEMIVHTVGSGSLTVNSALSAGSLTKSGAGTLVLGNAANSYAGATHVLAGTLKLGADGAMPAASSLIVAGGARFDLNGFNQTAAGITVRDSGIVQNTGSAAALSLGGSNGGVDYIGAAGGGTIAVGTLNLATTGAASASHVFNIGDGEAASDLTVTAVIADGSVNAQSLEKSGLGTLTLSGVSTYGGNTRINAGTLALGIGGGIPGTSNVTISGGKLDVGALAGSVASLALESGAVVGAAGGSLSAASAFNLQSGTVDASLGGAAALIKSTNGTVTLRIANTYAGGTQLNGGTLSVGSDGYLGNAAGSLTFNGGILQITGTGFNSTSRSIVWNTGGGFDIADENNTFTIGQNLTGTGALGKVGLGTLVLNGTLNAASVTVSDGALQLGGANRFTNAPSIAVNGTAYLDLNGHDNAIGSLTFSGGEVATGTGKLTLGGNVIAQRSIWPATISGKLDLGSATRTFDVTHGSSTDPNGLSTDLTVSAVISGSGVGLTKTGNGFLTLSNANTYTGLTTVSAGTLVYGISNAIGAGGVTVNGATAVLSLGYYSDSVGAVTLSAGSITGSGAGTLTSTVGFTMNNDGAALVSAILGGGVGLTKTGSGTLTLSRANTYTGLTTVSAGTLAYGVSNAIYTGGVTVNGTGAVFGMGIYNDSVGAVTLTAGSITGTGTLTSSAGFTMNNDAAASASVNLAGSVGLMKTGSGTLTLGGASAYTGVTTVNGGVLSVSSLANGGLASNIGKSSSAAANLVLGGGTLQYTGATASSDRSFTLAGTASSTMAVTSAGTNLTLAGANLGVNSTLAKSGGGTLTLTGSQTWGNGATVAVQSGTLRYNLAGGAMTSVAAGNNVTVANGATLELAGGNSALSDNVRNVDIVNNNTSTTGVVVSGTNQAVGGISGSGSTSVQANASLTADSIVQNTLTIGSGGSVTIRETGTGLAATVYTPPADYSGTTNLAGTDVLTSGTPAGSLSAGGAYSAVTTVPEPGLCVLLATAAACLGWHMRRRRG